MGGYLRTPPHKGGAAFWGPRGFSKICSGWAPPFTPPRHGQAKPCTGREGGAGAAVVSRGVCIPLWGGVQYGIKTRWDGKHRTCRQGMQPPGGGGGGESSVLDANYPPQLIVGRRPPLGGGGGGMGGGFKEGRMGGGSRRGLGGGGAPGGSVGRPWTPEGNTFGN